MCKKFFRLIILLAIFFPLLSMAQQTNVPTPEQYFGFKPGADRQLFDYEQLIQYLQKSIKIPSGSKWLKWDGHH